MVNALSESKNCTAPDCQAPSWRRLETQDLYLLNIIQKKYENRVDIDHILHARGRHAHVLLRVCEFHRIFANITDLQNKKVSNRKSYTISSHNHTHLMKKHMLAEFHVERATPRARFLAREKIRESAKFKNLKKYLSLNCCSSRKKCPMDFDPSSTIKSVLCLVWCNQSHWGTANLKGP